MDAQELEEIERAMAEEHRRDREALERLKRFLDPTRNGNGRSAHATNSSKPASGKDDAETVVVYTIIGKVAEIMTADPTHSWTGPQMVQKLVLEGMPITAKRQVPTVTRVFRKLVKRGVIRRVKKGAGTIPSAYRALSTAQDHGSVGET